MGGGTIDLRGSGDEVIEQPRLPQDVGVVVQGIVYQFANYYEICLAEPLQNGEDLDRFFAFSGGQPRSRIVFSMR
jgi:hypothetical protein